jgi:hypothetical protein
MEMTEKDLEDKVYDILLIKLYIDYLKEYSPKTLIEYEGEFVTLKTFENMFDKIGKLKPEPWSIFLNKIAEMALNDTGYMKYLQEEH